MTEKKVIKKKVGAILKPTIKAEKALVNVGIKVAEPFNDFDMEEFAIPEIKYIADYEPKYATEGSACFDLEVFEKTRIYPGEIVLVDLGIKMEIPKGYYLEIIPRSSIYKSGLMLANSIGIIDSDYRGPIKAPLRNLSKNKVIVTKGQRIIQAILKPVINCSLQKVTELSGTERGEGGFGSSGV